MRKLPNGGYMDPTFVYALFPSSSRSELKDGRFVYSPAVRIRLKNGDDSVFLLGETSIKDWHDALFGSDRF